MVKIVDEYIVKGDSSGAKKASKEAEESFDKLGKSVGKSVAVAQVALAAASKAFNIFVGELNKGIEAAKEFERTNIRLNISLQNAGLNAAEYNTALNAQAGILEDLTNVSDELIRNMQAQAIAFGASGDQATDFAEAAIALANVSGKSLNETFLQLRKTLGGYAGELGEVLPQVKDLTKEQLQNGEAVALVNEKFSEFLGLEAEGLTGTINSLAKAWDNVAEAVAKVAGSAAEKGLFERAADSLADFTEDLAAAAEEGGFLGAFGLATATILDPETAGRARAERLRQRREAAALTPEQVQAAQAPVRAERARTRAALTAGEADKAGFNLPFEMLLMNIAEEANQRRIENHKGMTELLEQEEREAGERMQEQAQKNLDQRNAAIEEAQEQELAAMRERNAAIQTLNLEMAQAGLQAFNMISNTAIKVFEDMAAGQEIAWGKIVRGTLSALGKMLFAQGTSDAMKGVSRGLGSYGWDATAYALIALGAAEQTAGVGMIAGTALAGGGAVSGVGDFGGGGLGAGGTAGAGTATRGNVDIGGRETVINVYGALTNEETAVLVTRAQQEANSRGMR